MAKLGVNQQKFLELYLGDEDSETYGNATLSYLGAYPNCKSKNTAGVEGKRLLSNPKIQEELAARATAVAEVIESTAETVLGRAEQLFLMAIGEVPMISEKMVRDPETGEYRKVTHMLRQTNLQMADRILQTIGRNKLVQAFQDNLEVSHHHYLEKALADRSKKAEEAAEERRLRVVGE